MLFRSEREIRLKMHIDADIALLANDLNHIQPVDEESDDRDALTETQE